MRPMIARGAEGRGAAGHRRARCPHGTKRAQGFVQHPVATLRVLAYDSFEIGEEYRPVLVAHAKYLRQNPEASMLIQGNADERGADRIGQPRRGKARMRGATRGLLGEEHRRGDILYGSEY